MAFENVALLGTGLMGFPMARNLARAGVPVTVWNRTQAKAEPLADEGAAVAASTSAAVTGADVIITMMSDGPTVLSVIEEVSRSLSRGALWIDMSSTKPDEARAAHAALSELGVGFLDAPVSGGTKGADAASLAIMAGGKEKDFFPPRPGAEGRGRAVHVGPTGAGQLLELWDPGVVAVTIRAPAG
ncbi:MAG: NAD(P)-dependent oxidoreductase, partial [Tateyamaria sp.]